MKRVYFQSIKGARKLLSDFELTPARFDVLYAIYNHHRRECYRVALVQAIGTVKSNIWRLCDALEELGFAYSDYDGFRIIRLTPKGVAYVEKILEKALDLIDETLDKAANDVGIDAPLDQKRVALAAMLKNLRTNLGDRHVFDVYHRDLERRLRDLVVLPKLKWYWLRERSVA